MQHIQRAAPILPVHQVVPVGDDVIDRTAAGAKGDAAIHAACALLFCLIVGQGVYELAPVLQAHLGRLVGFLDAFEFQKAGNFAHVYSLGGNRLGVGRAPQLAQRTSILYRHDLHEELPRAGPVVQQIARAKAAGIAIVVLDQAAQYGFVGFSLAVPYGTVPGVHCCQLVLVSVRLQALKLHHGQVAAAAQAVVRVPYISYAAGHPGSKITASCSQHHNRAARHVFAAMIAGALHHSRGARVAHGKAFAGDAIEIGFSRQGAVQHRVAGNDVVGAEAAKVIGRANDDAAARQALADVIVGLADQVQCDAMGQESPEALSRRAVALDMYGVVRQAFMAVARGHHARQHGAYGAIAIAHRGNERDLFAAFDRAAAAFYQLMVQRPVQRVVLFFGLVQRDSGRHGVEDTAEVQALRFPVLDARAHVEQIDAADHVVEATDAQLRHDFAQLFGHEEEVVHNVLGLALELLAQHRILRGYAHRAGVQVAFAHHDAAFHHQWCRCKTELIRAQQGADGHIAAGLHLAVGLYADAAAQVVQQQGLLRLGQAQLPWRAGMLDG